MNPFLIPALVLLLIGMILYFLYEQRRWKRLAARVAELKDQDDSSLGRSVSAREQVILKRVEELAEERSMLRQQIKEEAFNLETILSSMTEAFLAVDQHRRILLVNRSLLELFAIPSDPVGKTILMAIREAEIEKVAAITMETAERQCCEIIIAGQSDSANRFFEINAAPVRARTGEVNGAVLVLHEITQLRQGEIIRRDFVSNVSHELRTPLAIFQGYLENLLDQGDMPPAEVKESLLTMQKHSRRLNALLEDLLVLTRLESRKIEPDFVSLRFGPFLRQMVRDWNLRCEVRDISINYDGEDQVPVVRADISRMEQVMRNLIENAVKHTGKGGGIRVGAKALVNAVEIWVTDNGNGIPPSDLPHIFERFYRVDKARSRDGGGTGLGLAIAKEIVVLHEGEIGATSEYGKGTQVWIRLPAEEESLGETAASAQ